MNTYGLERSLTPRRTFTPLAWELDNSSQLKEGEVRIALDKVHVEGTSFRQICQEAGNDEEQIKEKKYPSLLEGYTGELVLVGINYDKKTKQHECIIDTVNTIYNKQ